MIHRAKKGLKWAFSALVILGAAGIAYALVTTKPEPPRAEKRLEGTLVEVIDARSARHEVKLHAKGTVVPAREIVIQPELSGRVKWQSPELVAGGRFEKGEPVLRIDPRDYQLAVESFRSQVNRQKLELAVEQRRGEVAKREWESFGDLAASEAQKELAQRKPYLEASELALKAAQSSLKKAQLDLERTTLRAPFNAMVVSENVDVGQLIGPQDRVATLVGTDEYRVQVSVPVASLRTIRVRKGEEPGSKVRVTQHVGSDVIVREGEIIRQLPDLDPGGSMARLLVNIPDPLGEDDSLPLLLGSFVDVAAEAEPIDDAIEIPRTALHGGARVFVMNDEQLLEIRDVEIGWSTEHTVLLTAGVEPGERIVTSRIATPVPNMPLRTAAPESKVAPGPELPTASAETAP